MLNRLSARVIPQEGDPIEVTFSKATADFSQKNFSIDQTIRSNNKKKNGWAVSPRMNQPHWAHFIVKTPVAIPEGSSLEVRLDHSFELPHFTLGRFRLSVADDARAATNKKIETWITELVRKDVSERSDAEKKRLADHFRKIAPSLAAAHKKIANKEKQKNGLKGTSTLVMRERKSPRKTHLFNGGNWMSHGEQVTRNVPAIMPPLPANAPSNRLGMAQWIVTTDHPLTARVAVNRFWEQIFGNGIVATVADFGTQGDKPTHPALLDDLAVRFATEQSWSVKALLKTFVMSATYRQQSHVTPALIEKDPQNQLLARGPR